MIIRDRRCTCPDLAEQMRAELEGVELVNRCPVHSEPGRQADTERARADAYRAVVAGVRADLAEAEPEALSPRQLLEAAIRNELEPDPTPPPALALNDTVGLQSIVTGAFGKAGLADPTTPIDGTPAA